MKAQDLHKFEMIEKVAPVVIRPKIRRGLVHSTICKMLNITHNNRNVKIIKAVLSKYNPKEVRLRGLEYYRFESHE